MTLLTYLKRPEYITHVRLWLALCCFFVLLMVTVGGLTRLTGSGLSMTDWKPVTGWFPPLSELAWQEEFSAYQQSPQFQQINADMDVHGFKQIFWLEYIHRVLGRLMGFLVLLPLLFFTFKRVLTAPFALKLYAIAAFIGAQGVVGWLMVKSGLRDDPHVSHFWLSFHLMMAAGIFSWLLFYVQRLGAVMSPQVARISKRGYYYLLGFLGLFLIQMVLGGFVAGLKAGLVYPTFPLMGDSFIPPEWSLVGEGKILFWENPVMMQMLHRFGAYLLLALGPLLVWRFIAVDESPEVVIRLALVVASLFFQVVIGVLLLLWFVPIALASFHQVIAFLILAQLLWLIFSVSRVRRR